MQTHFEIENSSTAETGSLQKGRLDKMATRLDQKIEHLENIVEQRLGLCQETWSGMRCTLPAHHEPPELHKFQIEFLADTGLVGNARAFADLVRYVFAEDNPLD